MFDSSTQFKLQQRTSYVGPAKWINQLVLGLTSRQVFSTCNPFSLKNHASNTQPFESEYLSRLFS